MPLFLLDSFEGNKEAISPTINHGWSERDILEPSCAFSLLRWLFYHSKLGGEGLDGLLSKVSTVP